MSEEETNVTVKHGNPFLANFKGMLGKGLGCLTLIIIAIVAIALLSGGGSDKGKQESKSSSSTQEQSATPTAITAKELAGDFDSNQVAAEAKWKDKFVEFSAAISNITDSGLSFYNVASKEFSATQISCKIADKQQLLPLKNEQVVKVRGVVGDQTIGVIEIKNCEVVK